MAHRSGFLIPNAGDQLDGINNLPSNRQAEPDAGDFSVLGNDRYGVLIGFNWSVSGGNFAVTSSTNVCVLNGSITTVGVSQVALQAGGSDDRFDLICVNASGLLLVKGVASTAPVFPFIPDGAAVLAAVFVPSGAATTSLSSKNIIDKRRLLLSGARGASAGSSVFLENRPDGASPATFKVTGTGATTIGSVTASPDGGGGLTFSGGDVTITTGLTVEDDLIVDGTAAIGGKLTAANFLSAPISGTPNASATVGSLFADETHGRLYIKRSTAPSDWAEIYSDEYPPGTVITTLLTGTAASNYLAGSWFLCNGQTIAVSEASRLADIFPTWVSGSALTLPDLRGKVLMGSSSLYPTYSSGGQDLVTLTTAHLPSHSHFAGNQTGSAGGHAHNGSVTVPAGAHNHNVQTSGAHQHGIDDPTHRHEGAEHGLNVPSYFIHARWGGESKLDSAAGADGSHTWNVDVSGSTVYASTGITGTRRDGPHSHSLDAVGDHTHTLALAAEAPHTHALPTETSVGGNQPFDNKQPYYVVNYYIKG